VKTSSHRYQGVPQDDFRDFINPKVEILRSSSILPKMAVMAIFANLMNFESLLNMRTFYPTFCYNLLTRFLSRGSSMDDFAFDFIVSLNTEVCSPRVYASSNGSI
jgi:hypothetical protein